jgi:hypothetical protein
MSLTQATLIAYQKELENRKQTAQLVLRDFIIEHQAIFHQYQALVDLTQEELPPELEKAYQCCHHCDGLFIKKYIMVVYPTWTEASEIKVCVICAKYFAPPEDYQELLAAYQTDIALVETGLTSS